MLMALALALAPTAQAQDAFNAHQLHAVGVTDEPTSPLRLLAPPSATGTGWHVGLLGEYSRAPLVSLAADGTATAVLDHLGVANLMASVRPVGRVRVTAAAPLFATLQGPAGATTATVGDVRVAVSATVLDGPVQLGLSPVLDLPTGAEGAYVGRPGMGGAGLVTARSTFGPVTVTGEVGPELTGSANAFDYTRLNTGLHAAYTVDPSVAINAEVRALWPLVSGDTTCACTPAELSVWGHLGRPSGAHWILGGAVGLNSDPGTSLFRVFVGGGFGRGSDADAVADSDEDTTGPADRFAPQEGAGDRGAGTDRPDPDEEEEEEDDDRAAAWMAGLGMLAPSPGGLPPFLGSLPAAGPPGGGLPGGGLPGGGLPGAPQGDGDDDSDEEEEEEQCEQQTIAGSAFHLPTVFFEPNRSALAPEGLHALIAAAEALDDAPGATLRVDVHTHERAGETFMGHIAERRQLQVLTVLVQHGVTPERVSFGAKGEPGDELADHRKARAELTLLGGSPSEGRDAAGPEADAAAPPVMLPAGSKECEEPAVADQAVLFGGSALRWNPASEPALAEATQAAKAGRVVAIVAHVGPKPISESRRDKARERAAAVRAELVDRGVDEHLLRIEVHDTVDPTRPRAPRVELHISDEAAIDADTEQRASTPGE